MDFQHHNHMIVQYKIYFYIIESRKKLDGNSIIINCIIYLVMYGMTNKEKCSQGAGWQHTSAKATRTTHVSLFSDVAGDACLSSMIIMCDLRCCVCVHPFRLFLVIVSRASTHAAFLCF